MLFRSDQVVQVAEPEPQQQQIQETTQRPELAEAEVAEHSKLLCLTHQEALRPTTTYSAQLTVRVEVEAVQVVHPSTLLAQQQVVEQVLTMVEVEVVRAEQEAQHQR